MTVLAKPFAKIIGKCFFTDFRNIGYIIFLEITQPETGTHLATIIGIPD